MLLRSSVQSAQKRAMAHDVIPVMALNPKTSSQRKASSKDLKHQQCQAPLQTTPSTRVLESNPWMDNSLWPQIHSPPNWWPMNWCTIPSVGTFLQWRGAPKAAHRCNRYFAANVDSWKRPHEVVTLRGWCKSDCPETHTYYSPRLRNNQYHFEIKCELFTCSQYRNFFLIVTFRRNGFGRQTTNLLPNRTVQSTQFSFTLWPKKTGLCKMMQSL